VSGSDGVHRKTTGLVGGSGKSGHLVSLDSGAHLENIRLQQRYSEREDRNTYIVIKRRSWDRKRSLWYDREEARQMKVKKKRCETTR
jgi:hypothetical protein